ncbi:RsmD family RNA methyltransferase [Candidatus Saccharibacteria bacterium]|nr:RsmD family RNA methyltransferase [Candidatus Saccharibacteria bacterium]MBR6122096.1 RsmD family RNA methyltransferase [Candidatus Saccharibacteria bacterium]
MRIISGKYKNRELKSPNSTKTHPMGERERLAIFNMLGNLEGKTILDLFAGTGALGLEALSRGAASATFVEKDYKALECLKDNLKNVDNYEVIKGDVYKIKLNKKYDIVFIDPPYDAFDRQALKFKKLLRENGVLVVSSPQPIDETSRKYANCYVTLVFN